MQIMKLKKNHKKSREKKSKSTQTNSTNPSLATWDRDKKIRLSKEEPHRKYQS